MEQKRSSCLLKGKLKTETDSQKTGIASILLNLSYNEKEDARNLTNDSEFLALLRCFDNTPTVAYKQHGKEFFL